MKGRDVSFLRKQQSGCLVPPHSASPGGALGHRRPLDGPGRGKLLHSANVFRG